MISPSLLSARFDELEQDMNSLQKDFDHLKNIIKMNYPNMSDNPVLSIIPEDLCQNFIGESGNDNH